MTEKAPPIKRGWMRKQGRSGLVKNWKTRYFVLADGKISYYVSEISEAPYGDGLKGELSLVNSEVVEEHTKTINDKQVFIVSYNGENNILMETDDPKETAEWAAAIRSHIKFYNQATASRVQSMAISRSGSGGVAGPRGSTSSTAEGEQTKSDATPTKSPAKEGDTAAQTSEIDGGSSPIPGVDSKRSSIARRKVSVAATAEDAARLSSSGTTATGADNNNNNNPSGAPPVMEYKVYSIDVIANVILDTVMNFLMNAEDRSKILKSILPTLQTTVMNATENFMEGESGKRGERVVLSAVILFFLIIVGVGNRYLFYLIQSFMYLAATGLMLAGVTMILNAVWELKDHFSLLLVPSPGNKVVTTGVYQLVRHPMYCGVIMLAFGWSISQRQIYKMVLSMILFVVLNYAAEKEEEFLEKKHPRAYPLYANTKRAMIPFLY